MHTSPLNAIFFSYMDPRVHRRLVSAPLSKTPPRLQTAGPPPAFEPTPQDEPEEIMPSPGPQYYLTFTITSPHRLFNTVEQSSDESTINEMFHRVISNLRQLRVLFIFIWADLNFLFVQHPFHTSYFFMKESFKDVVYMIFALFHDIFYGSRLQKCMLFSSI